MRTLALTLTFGLISSIAHACTATALSDVGDITGRAMMTGEIITPATSAIALLQS